MNENLKLTEKQRESSKSEGVHPDLLSKILIHCDYTLIKPMIRFHSVLSVLENNPEVLNSLCGTDNLPKNECIRILKSNNTLIKAIRRGIEKVTTFSTNQNDMTQLSIFNGLIFSSSDDHTLKVFDFNGFIVKKFIGHEGGIWTFDCCGKKIITGSTDKTSKIWDLETEQLITTLKYHRNTVRTLRVHENYIVTGSRDYTIGVWSIFGELLFRLDSHRQSVRCLDISDDYLVSGSYDGYCKLWDYKRGKLIRNIHKHQSRVYTVKMHGKYVASSGMDSIVKITNLDGFETKSHRIHRNVVGWINFKGNFLISSSLDGTTVKFNYVSGEVEYIIKAGSSIKGQKIMDALIIIATASDVKIYCFKTGRFIRTLITADAISKVEAIDWKIVVGYVQNKDNKISIFNYEPCK